jgi:hypothetical protein
MKLSVLFVLILGTIIFLVGPTIVSQKKCYDSAQTSVSDINSNAMMRGYGKQQVCENKFTVLSDLEICVQGTIGTDSLAPYKKIVADYIIPYIRPLTNTVKNQQNQHDAECSEFKTLLFTVSP